MLRAKRRVAGAGLLAPTTSIFWEKAVRNLPLEPVVALAAGVVILLYPKTLNYVVAGYLILTGGSKLLKQPR